MKVVHHGRVFIIDRGEEPYVVRSLNGEKQGSVKSRKNRWVWITWDGMEMDFEQSMRAAAIACIDDSDFCKRTTGRGKKL